MQCCLGEWCGVSSFTGICLIRWEVTCVIKNSRWHVGSEWHMSTTENCFLEAKVSLHKPTSAMVVGHTKQCEPEGTVHGESLLPENFPYPWHSKHVQTSNPDRYFSPDKWWLQPDIWAWDWFTHAEVEIFALIGPTAPCGSLWTEAAIYNPKPAEQSPQLCRTLVKSIPAVWTATVHTD